MSDNVHRLDDYRRFDAGSPIRCYNCGVKDVSKCLGDGGYVWACLNCPHPSE